MDRVAVGCGELDCVARAAGAKGALRDSGRIRTADADDGSGRTIDPAAADDDPIRADLQTGPAPAAASRERDRVDHDQVRRDHVLRQAAANGVEVAVAETTGADGASVSGT